MATYPQSCFEEPPPLASRIDLPDDDAPWLLFDAKKAVFYHSADDGVTWREISTLEGLPFEVRQCA